MKKLIEEEYKYYREMEHAIFIYSCFKLLITFVIDGILLWAVLMIIFQDDPLEQALYIGIILVPLYMTGVLMIGLIVYYYDCIKQLKTMNTHYLIALFIVVFTITFVINSLAYKHLVFLPLTR